EDDESFTARLANPTSGAVLGFQKIATVIIDSNERSIEFSTSDFQAPETAPFAEVTLIRAGDDLPEVSVDFNASSGTAKAGSDYASVFATIRFERGETNKLIGIPLFDNGLVDGERTIELHLSNSQPERMLGKITNAVLHIADNE